MLANLRRRSGGVHVAEEVLDPPEGHAAARVTHLQTERFVFSTSVVVGLFAAFKPPGLLAGMLLICSQISGWSVNTGPN